MSPVTHPRGAQMVSIWNRALTATHLFHLKTPTQKPKQTKTKTEERKRKLSDNQKLRRFDLSDRTQTPFSISLEGFKTPSFLGSKTKTLIPGQISFLNCEIRGSRVLIGPKNFP